MSKTLSFYNLTGGLNTVQDLVTINSTPNRTESPDMMNIEYYKLGGIQTMKGNTQIGQSLTNKISCGYEYILGNESYMIVATEDGRVYEYDKKEKKFFDITSQSGFEITGMTDGRMILDDSITNPKYYAVSYNNGVVIVNGWSVLWYNKKTKVIKNWIPALQTTEADPVTIHPNVVASYKGRLFLGANKTEQNNTTYKGGMLFYSGVGLGTQDTWVEDPSTGEDAGAFKEFFEDSSDFTALGTWAEYLAIHKEQNTYLLDGTADSSDDWSLKPHSEYTVPSQQSFVVANNSYYTYVPEAGGIHPLLTRSIYNNTYQGGELSFKIRDVFDFLDIDRYPEIYATHNPRKRYILFYMPMRDNLDSEGNFNGSGKCYIYDIQTKTWLLRKVPQYVTCAFKFDNDTYIGTKDGLVLQEFKGKTFNGEPIDFYWLSPPFIWGGGTNKTTSKEFRLKLLSSSANNFYIESLRDGNLITKQQRRIKNINDNLNGLVWDIDYNYPTIEIVGQTPRIKELGDWNPTNFRYIASNGYYLIKTIAGVMYHYQVDSTDYYTTKLITNTSWNVPVYNQPIVSPTYFVGYNQQSLFIKQDIATEGSHNYTTYTTSTSYAWVHKDPSDICFKNGDYYAWVNTNTGICKTNLVNKTETVTSLYGIILRTSSPGSNTYYLRLSPDIYNSIQQDLSNKTKGATYSGLHPNDFLVRTNQGYVNYITSSGVKIGWYIATYQDVRPSDLPLGFGTYNIDNISDTFQIGYGSGLSKNSSEDVTTTQTREVASGTSPTGLTKTLISGSATSSSIVISINGTNVTLDRYSSGDIGSVAGQTVYTESSTPVANADKGYSDTQLTTEVGTITASSSSSIIISSVVYSRYPQSDTERTITNYWNRYNALNDDTYVGEVTSTEPVYNYPDVPDLPESITDTVWDYSDVDDKTETYIIARPEDNLDVIYGKQNGNIYEDVTLTGYNTYNNLPANLRGDAWLQQGYQTKRMLLPNQYFETIQFKFSGNSLNDSICISGFEVDGIQLAETPWA